MYSLNQSLNQSPNHSHDRYALFVRFLARRMQLDEEARMEELAQIQEDAGWAAVKIQSRYRVLPAKRELQRRREKRKQEQELVRLIAVICILLLFLSDVKLRRSINTSCGYL